MLLFSAAASTDEWQMFPADGYPVPVTGRIVTPGSGTCCGVALGGLGTGAIDLDPSGTLGFVTAFPVGRRQDARGAYQPFARSAQLGAPFLALAAQGQTWVLADRSHLDGTVHEGCTEPGMLGELQEDPAWRALWHRTTEPIPGVAAPSAIRYWGHYPIVDMEFELDAPLSVGLRAWSPFVVGDADTSNVPGAVFEVRVRNDSDHPVHATVCLSFPGPLETEPPLRELVRTVIDREIVGVDVRDAHHGYALAVERPSTGGARTGGALHGAGWAGVATSLPDPGPGDGGASLAVDATIGRRSEAVVRFFLGWFASGWVGGHAADLRPFEQWDLGPWNLPGRATDSGVRYESRYALRFPDALSVVAALAEGHAEMLSRIVGWQAAVYADPHVPGWLQDCLINHLNLLTEDSFWAAPSRELGAWSYPDGAFGMVESPRGCAVTGCIVSNWYGDLPLLYFFPDLERAVLRNYAAYLRPDGAVPFLYPDRDLTIPTYEWLLPLNGPCFVDLVGRLWLRTGDDAVLREFYQAVKANTEFTMTLRGGPRTSVAVHREGRGQEWWEHTPVFGVVTHAAGLRLATLQIAARMADAIGDPDFAGRCRQWIADGTRIVEDEQWQGDSYLFFRDEDTGRSSDDIHSSQLDGEWASRFHGFEGVFDGDRVRKALETIASSCLVPTGALSIVPRDGGSRLATVDWPANAPEYGEFMAEMLLLGATYAYAGQAELGLDIAHRVLRNVVCLQGHGWDLPNMVRLATGERDFGTDYFQNLMIWALPAAIEGTDLAGPSAGGGLVDRMLAAAR